ncbi:MAG: hypothetical protein A2007_03610 [Verrucomicrobia bacterium GWC2_42_7]|nr:MAG: hypothetical protein A2007_03610 [Verrucomicrobia bacterium GWC2_42_7]
MSSLLRKKEVFEVPFFAEEKSERFYFGDDRFSLESAKTFLSLERRVSAYLFSMLFTIAHSHLRT